jgi:DNA-binding CsgD family transcriptional regulator
MPRDDIQVLPSSPLWSSASVEHVASDAATRLREASAAYRAVDEAVVKQRIATMIRALDSALCDDEISRFEEDTAAAVRERLSGGFGPRDIVLAMDAVERAVEELTVAHEAPQAVGSPRWRVIQRTLRHTERAVLLDNRCRQSATTDIHLSAREREVLALLAEGMRTREVADRLSLSPVTVRTYVERSMEKLGALTRTQAVALAFAIGAL